MTPIRVFEPIVGELPVRFTKCDSGWIVFSVEGLTGDLEVWATDWIDPFPDMIRWLETVAQDQPVSWAIDQEGTIARFTYVPLGQSALGRAPAHLIYAMSDERQLLWLAGCAIDRVAIVQGFYGAFRSFVESDAYRREEWESRWPLGVTMDDVTEEEEGATGSWSGEKLRDLRSPAIEAFLAAPHDDRQLPIDFAAPKRKRRAQTSAD